MLSVSPTLPAEMLQPPFRPAIAGRVAFFFGPMAGALISIISLRRMGYPIKARHVAFWTFLIAIVFAAIILSISEGLGRLIGLGAEIGFYKLYPTFQEREFAEWQTAHPGMETASGWKAVGWGFAGLTMFLLVAIVVGVVMSLLLQSLVQ